jgi:hypothetical protein
MPAGMPVCPQATSDDAQGGTCGWQYKGWRREERDDGRRHARRGKEASWAVARRDGERAGGSVREREGAAVRGEREGAVRGEEPVRGGAQARGGRREANGGTAQERERTPAGWRRIGREKG